MRVSLLLQREPFGEILENTLARYFESQDGIPYLVEWRAGEHVQKEGRQGWLCNPYLNIFFRPDCRKEPLQPAVYEFSRSARAWRTPLNRLYVRLATGRISSRYFANAILDIDPPLLHADQLVIIGGNHHIRLLDYHHQYCTVISKHGFDLKLMLNDIAVRNEFPRLPVPKLIDHAPSGVWYREELILGTPINRLKDPRDAKDAIRQIMPSMFELYSATKRVDAAEEYIQGIEARIQQLTERNHLLPTAQKGVIQEAVTNLVGIAWLGGGTITTVQAHGDFQPANILVGDGGPWLIDWEYTMRRQTAYDGLVFVLASRRSSGFAQRLKDAIEGEMNNPLLPDEWVVLETIDREEREQLLALFLLEELELRLIENDNVLFNFLDAGIVGFCDELEVILSFFKEGKK